MIVGLVAAIVVLAVWFVVFWVEPLGAVRLLEWLTPSLRYRVQTRKPIVALSFDDGPNPVFTRQVLGILQEHDAKATFFLIGERALRHPEMVARIKAEGHEVGNHYFKNSATLGHSDAKFLSYIEQTEKAIGIGAGAKLFRPPGGVAWPRQLRLARAQGYECVLGCAYPHDPIRPPVRYIQWLVEKNLATGTIVILHDGISDPTRGIRALPHILNEGRRRGLRFVSIGELMRAEGAAKPKI